MPPSQRVKSLVRNIAGKAQMERDLSEELSSHVELLTEKNMKDGMNEKDARRAAMVEVGGVEQVKEEVRAGRTGFALETFMMVAVLRTRLAEHDSDPASGTRWEELRERLLKRRNA